MPRQAFRLRGRSRQRHAWLPARGAPEYGGLSPPGTRRRRCGAPLHRGIQRCTRHLRLLARGRSSRRRTAFPWPLSISLHQRVVKRGIRGATITCRTRHWPDRSSIPARPRSRKPCIGDLRGNAVSSPSGRGMALPDGTRKQPEGLSRPKGRPEDEGTHQ